MNNSAVIAASWFRAYHQTQAKSIVQDKTMPWDQRERLSLHEYKAAAVYASYIHKV